MANFHVKTSKNLPGCFIDGLPLWDAFYLLLNGWKRVKNYCRWFWVNIYWLPSPLKANSKWTWWLLIYFQTGENGWKSCKWSLEGSARVKTGEKWLSPGWKWVKNDFRVILGENMKWPLEGSARVKTGENSETTLPFESSDTNEGKVNLAGPYKLSVRWKWVKYVSRNGY